MNHRTTSNLLRITLSTLVLLLSTHTVEARLPIIIDKADPSYPADLQDQNYLPSDPKVVDTVEYKKNIEISQTFLPIKTGTTDATGNPVYQNQDINQIQQRLELGDYTNHGLDYFAAHTAQRYQNPLADTQDIIRQTLEYDTSNLARRSLPAALQSCLIGQRLISSVRTLNGQFTGTTVDSVICQTPQCPHPVRISEVATALASESIFANPDITCTQSTKLFPLSTFISVPSISTSLSQETYHQLYQRAIEPIDDNSLGMVVTQCDLTSSGQAINCKKERRSLPQAAAPASGATLMHQFIPANANISSRDYADTTTGIPITDKPNTITFLASFFKNFFSGQLKTASTFSGHTQVTYSIDKRLQQGLEVDEAAISHFIPDNRGGLKNQSSSTTNNKGTLDPGKANEVGRVILRQLLYPSSWQPQ